MRREITFTSPDGLFVRPRGWHLVEKRAFFHNAEELIRAGSGPYFYWPKLREPPPKGAHGMTCSTLRRCGSSKPDLLAEMEFSEPGFSCEQFANTFGTVARSPANCR